MGEQAAAGRPRRRGALGPGVGDGVELAAQVAMAKDDTAHDTAVQQVLRNQALLLRAQLKLVGLDTWERRLSVLLRLMLGLAGFVLLAAAAFMVIQAARSKTVVVEAFDTPPAMADRGVSGRVLAGYVQDALSVIQASNVGLATRANISNAWTDDIAVEVPRTGMSVGEIDRLLRRMLGRDTHVSGALVRNPDATVSLTIRASGEPPKTFTAPEAELQTLSVQAAEYVYGRFEPRLFSSYLLRNGRTEEALPLLEEAFARVPERSRSAIAANWAIALSFSGAPLSEVVAKHRLAVSLDPNNWGAWSNLLTSLYDYEGEEGVMRAGREGTARALKADRSQAVAANDALSNYRTLVQDWGGVQKAVEASMAAKSGKLHQDADNAISLAWAYIGQHDWRGAEYALAMGRQDQPIVPAMRNYVEALRRFEAGDMAGALPRFEALRSAWKTDEAVRFSAVSEPCLEGVVLARMGRAAEAWPIFDEVGRWVICLTSRAEVLEAMGDRAGADRAFVDAIALAPSSPYTYQRKALTLMARGDLQGAAKAHAAAQTRGPRWADPIKGEGDIAAAQGRWKDAIVAYRRAQPLAPKWAALHIALARALIQQGKRRDARETITAAQGMALSPGEQAALRALSARLES